MFSTLYGTYFSFSMHFKLSSVIGFNLDKSKKLSSGNELRILKEKPFENNLRKREIAGNQQFLFFSYIVLYPCGTNFGTCW